MASWRDVPADVLKAAANMCDGHTIFDPQAFSNIGVPQDLVDRCTEVYESNFENPKYTISGPDGKPVNQMKGVYGLDALASMIRDLDLSAPDKIGRGSQAQVWKEAIHAHLNQQTADA